jgi:hypothetical protein
MKAIFEVEFNQNSMIDSESLKKEYGNDLLLCMKELYDSDGMGIFDKELKLIRLKK